MFLDRNFSIAEKFKKNGNLDDAILIYNKILSKFPLNKRAQLGKKLCINNKHASQKEIDLVIELFENNLFSQAKSEVNNLIIKYPKDENLYNISGAIFSKLRNYSAAEKNYKKAILLHPNFAQAYNNLAETFNQIKKYSEAIELCKKAISINNNYAEAYNNLGVSLMNLRKYDESKINFEISIKLNNPNVYSVYNNLALVYAYLNNLKKSAKILLECINMQPSQEEAVNSLSNIMVYLDKEERLFIEEYLIKNLELFPLKSRLLTLSLINIQNFIDANFNSTLKNDNKLNKTYNEFLESGLKIDPKDLKFVEAYKNFITSLKDLDRSSKNSVYKIESNTIYHLGESHCLSFANKNIKINNEDFIIKPLITIGLKAWHLSEKKHNKQKSFFVSQLSKIPDNSKVLISIGEIDTRIDEGIISYYQKSNKNLKIIIKDTVHGYINFIENYFKNKNIEKFYFTVAAPYIQKNNSSYNSELSKLRIEVIKTFNEILISYISQLKSNYINTYRFTSDKYGENNKRFMLDEYHLSPNCLSLVEENIKKIT